ncbi:MAG: hypothetical protein IBX57_00020 [Gammaproteobacteria bacterium]|nr:hypothetical protein [Gammaproteobacteria bacterium]
MSLTIRNAAPRGIYKGIKDNSGRAPVIEPILIPTHLPHLFIYSERGETLPQLTSGTAMVSMYGQKTFDPKGPYYNHATPFVETIGAEGNSMMIQRLVPPGANPPATLRLSVDVLPEFVPVYERDEQGKHKLDESGNKIPTGDLVEGFNLRWLVGPTIKPEDDGRILEDNDPRLLESGNERILDSRVGDGKSTVGQMTNSDGEQSTIYPIMDFEVQHFGSYGNNVGIRFSAPTTDSAISADDQTIEEQLAYLYRLQIVERDTQTFTSKTVETLFGEQTVDFSFKEGVFNPRVQKELYIDDAVLPAYSQEAAAGLPEIQAPFKRIHVYKDHLETILSMVQAKEAPHGYVPDGEENLHLVNVFGGTDWNNIPYESLIIQGPSEGGVLLSSSSTHYCTGGYDGVMNFETFDLAVRHQLTNYGDLEAKFMDMAMYPQSVLYDSGFSLETKYAFFVPMGKRKDIYPVVSTQDVSQPQNTASEEQSIAVALRSKARLYPESEVYGTPTCRALIVGHSGYLLNSNYKGLLPLTLEIAQKSARYMGAGNGIWKTREAFDMPPNNRVLKFKGVNAEWVSDNVRSINWDTGLTWVQNYDRSSLFFPGIQTVYDDDSSVLNSAINMIAAVELEKVAFRTWRDLTGISGLTPEQFMERSDQLIEEDVRDKFGDRIIVQAETFYSSYDEQRGYSWACNIHMYAPNMKTVGSFTVVAHRIEDYPG